MNNQEHLRVWRAWHQASIDRDQEALLSLYAEDATLEAPLVPATLSQSSGVVQGRERIKAFLDAASGQATQLIRPDIQMHWWREDRFFSSGDTLIWEYPRQTPSGDQIDIVEVMQIMDGRIRYHRVYWGWRLISSMRRA